MSKFQEHVTERLGARAHYPKLESCVYSAGLPLVNAPMTWPRIGGNWWGPRILAAIGPEQIILSAHRQRLTGFYSPGISYELISIDLSLFVWLDSSTNILCPWNIALGRAHKCQQKMVSQVPTNSNVVAKSVPFQYIGQWLENIYFFAVFKHLFIHCPVNPLIWHLICIFGSEEKEERKSRNNFDNIFI